MRWIIGILLGLLGFYIVIMALAFFLQRKALYFPPQTYVSPETLGLPMEEVRTPNGQLGWYAPPRGDAMVVMVFHGNASDISSNTHIFADLLNAGYGVYSVGYAGYPGNAGVPPTQAGIVASAQAQYDELRSRGIPAERIAFYGTSLGSGVAAQLAVTRPPILLVMDAPFNSVLDMAKQTARFLPVEVLLRDHWRSDVALQSYDGPLVWIHGDNDPVIGLSQGAKLYAGYAGPKAQYLTLGSGHTGNWALGGRDVVLAALANPSDMTP